MEKNKKKKRKSYTREYNMTGEDILLLRDNRKKDQRRPIIDTHQDGA